MQNLPQQFQTLFISETKDFFWIFHCIYEMCMKFRAFQKNDEYPSLFISEITDVERRALIKRLKALP